MLNPVKSQKQAGRIPALAWVSVGRWGWLLTAAVCLLAALPRLTSLSAFLANDETMYWQWSHTFFFSLLRGDWPGTIVGPGNPSVTLFWSHSLVMGLKYGWAWLQGVQATALTTWPDFQPEATLEPLLLRRWPIVLFNTLAVVLAYRLARPLYGERVALVAAILLALDPFYLADSRTSRGEGLLAGLILLTLLCYLSYWMLARRRYLILAGVLTGLALLTKFSAVSLVAWAALATPLLAAGQSEQRRPNLQSPIPQGYNVSYLQLHWRSLLTPWLGLVLAAAATFWLLWPAMWTAPLQALGYVARFISDVGVSGRENYFFNQIYTDQLLPLFYPVVFILRITPLALVGLIAALGYLGQSWRRRSLGESDQRQPLLTALLLLFVLIYGVMMTIGTLKRDWYLLPVFPAIDVVAAVGLTWAGQRLWQWWGRSRISPSFASAGGLAAILLVQALTALPAHPYYYTYWNPLVLGDRWAADAVRVGWDLDLSAGAYYLNSKPHAEELRVATRSTRGFQQIFKGHTIRWVPEQPWIQADYLVVRRNHLQREEIDPALLAYVEHLKIDHVVNIGGVDYLWVYEGPRAQYFAGPSTLAGKAILMGYNLGQSAKDTPSAITNNQLPTPNLQSPTSNPTPLAPSDTLAAKFYWQNQGMTPDDDLFLQLVDANQYVWSEAVAQPLPGFEKAALTDKQLVESQLELLIPAGTPPGTYFLRSGVYSRSRQETLGYFTLASDGDKVSVEKSPDVTSKVGLNPAYPLNATLSPQLTLWSFDLPDKTLFLSRPTWLTLYWQAGPQPGADYVIALQLLDQQGQETAYWLGRPVLSGYPTNQWAAGEIVRDPWRLELPANLVPGDYTLQLNLFDAASQAKVGQTGLGPVQVVKRRQQFELPAVQHPLQAGLGDRINLLGYDLSTEPITGGGRVRLTLYWQASGPLATSYTVFAHLLNPAGQVVGQHDGLPAEGAIPTTEWAAHEIISDRHLIEFPALPPGDYNLVVGMYDSATGQRLPAFGGGTVIPLETIPLQ